MKKYILIGFRYKKSRCWTTLPGIIIDLYQAYKTLMKSNPDEIIVVTDIDRDSKTEFLRDAILNQTVDENILDFIVLLKERKQHVLFDKTTYNFVNDKISAFLSDSDNVFIYYTGHAENGNIVLPNDNIWSFCDFRDLIIAKTTYYASIFIAMDCCQGTGLGLPYILKNGIYRLVPDHDFLTHKDVICISSASKYENSAATRNGSFFTQALFKALANKTLSISSVLSSVSKYCQEKSKLITQGAHIQTATIHSSMPNLKIIWPWVFRSIQTKHNNTSIHSIHYDQQNYYILLKFMPIKKKYPSTSDINEHKQNTGVTFTDIYLGI